MNTIIATVIAGAVSLPSFAFNIDNLPLPTSNYKHYNDLEMLDYDHFFILYNCKNRGFEHYFYITKPDTGNVKRPKSFFQEKRLPKHCRQSTTNTYKNADTEPKFDRGHGVPANHFDFSDDAANATFTMANVVPHQAYLNRKGLWRFTDKLIECNRSASHGGSMVWGGVIWGNDASNDYFMKSHGVITPDYLYKIIVKTNGDTMAWIMPNTSEPKAKNQSDYIVSVADIELVTGHTFPIPNKNEKPVATWQLPKFCDLK